MMKIVGGRPECVSPAARRWSRVSLYGEKVHIPTLNFYYIMM